MADRSLKLRELRRLLNQLDVEEDSSLGKGSHTMFLRKLPEGTFSFPIPTNCDQILAPCIRSLRRRLKLTPDDGVSDADFYGKHAKSLKKKKKKKKDKDS